MKTFLQRTLFSVAASMLAATSFAQTTIPVSPCDMNGWHAQKNNGDNKAALSPDPIGAPGAPGSGQLKVGKSGQTTASFTSGNHFKNTLISAFTELKYSTYVVQNGSSKKAPFLLLEVSYDNDQSAEDEWIFEPAYQSTAVAVGSWQTWDALKGKWYSAKGLAGSGPSARNVKSLTDLINAKPSSRLLNSHTIKFVAGSVKNVWEDFEGNIDQIVVGIAGQTTTFDLVCGSTAAPTITCPGDVRLPAEAGECSATYTLTAPTATDACGNTLTAIPSRSDNKPMTDEYPVGNTTVTWTATDEEGAFVTCTQIITVYDDQAPVITCPTLASTVRNTDEGVCSYTVKGTEFDATVTENCTFQLYYTINGGEPVPASSMANVVLQKGENIIVWTAADPAGNQTTCSFTITVVDNQAPVINSVTATPDVLWSPNHKMVDITLTYDVTDNCGTFTPEVLCITSDEHDNGLGDGNTEADWEFGPDGYQLKLRAERSGLGDGRVYTIKVKVSDEAGNDAYGTVYVTVPHNQNSTAENSALDVVVGPNPTLGSFNVTVNSANTTDKITAIVSNVSGHVVYRNANMSAGQMITFGNSLPAGTYFAEFRQGNTYKTVTLSKN